VAEVLLTIDTSTRAGSVAVSRGAALLGEILVEAESTHSDRLLVSVEQLLGDLALSLADCDAFAVVHGPGSFTGLRVGIATAKGLALGTGKPLLGVSSLATLAMAAPHSRYPVCALLDARKQEVYAGLFSWGGGLPQLLGAEAALSPERLLDGLHDETLFVGSGAVCYRTLIARRLGPRAHFLPWPLHAPRASLAAALALEQLRRGEGAGPECLQPRYLRLSEAEIAWGRKEENGAIGG
jgi:tRNA threonylcarbamoyladenosine biosynthesis protein TsaB